MAQTAPSLPSVEDHCPLPINDPLFQQYHDEEWGVPQLADNVFYEKVCLEGFQSGLSWRTVLHRRSAFRQVFAEFDMDVVAQYTAADLTALASDARIIRNRRKIASTVNNAKRAIELRHEYGSLAKFFWQFEPEIDTRPTLLTLTWLANNTHSPESTALAASLKHRGWTFVGPTNMYALMQALGIVNDHVSGCPRRIEVEQIRNSFSKPV